MSLTEGFIWGTSIMMLGSVGLLAFAIWIRVQDERLREKEAQDAEREAFRKAFTIHQH
ncbi:hypothetical protein CCAE64S_01299 [Castellaniella caeni]